MNWGWILSGTDLKEEVINSILLQRRRSGYAPIELAVRLRHSYNLICVRKNFVSYVEF